MTLFTLSEDVAAAKAAGKPIVALESTIITHGMPYPQNIEVARRSKQRCVPKALFRPQSRSWTESF